MGWRPYPDECGGPGGMRQASQVRGAVLCHDDVDVEARQRDRTSTLTSRHDSAILARRCRKSNDPNAAAGSRAARKVGCTAGPEHESVVAPFGLDLAEQVDLIGGVDRDEPVDRGEFARAVSDRYRPEVERRMAQTAI